MAFPNPPKTWSVGEQLTAANFNAQFRDALLLTPHNIPKTADQSVPSSTALIDDTHLQFAIASSEAWEFQFVLMATGPGFVKVALNAPTGAAGWWAHYRSTTGSVDVNIQSAATFVDGETFNGTDNPDFVLITGFVLNSTTAGTFKLRWAQVNSNGTATVIKRGSRLERREV